MVGELVLCALVAPLLGTLVMRLLADRVAAGVAVVAFTVSACLLALGTALVLLAGGIHTTTALVNTAKRGWTAEAWADAGHDTWLSGPCAVVAVVAAICAARAWRRQRVALRAAGDEAAALPGKDVVVVVAGDHPDAFTLPGSPGRIVVTESMRAALSPDELGVVLAHERAHLSGRHHRYVDAARLAAAGQPLLRPVARLVEYGVERWADERAAVEVGDRVRVARAIGAVALVSAAAGPPMAARAGTASDGRHGDGDGHDDDGDGDGEGQDGLGDGARGGGRSLGGGGLGGGRARGGGGGLGSGEGLGSDSDSDSGGDDGLGGGAAGRHGAVGPRRPAGHAALGPTPHTLRIATPDWLAEAQRATAAARRTRRAWNRSWLARRWMPLAERWASAATRWIAATGGRIAATGRKIAAVRRGARGARAAGRGPSVGRWPSAGRGKSAAEAWTVAGGPMPAGHGAVAGGAPVIRGATFAARRATSSAGRFPRSSHAEAVGYRRRSENDQRTPGDGLAKLEAPAGTSTQEPTSAGEGTNAGEAVAARQATSPRVGRGERSGWGERSGPSERSGPGERRRTGERGGVSGHPGSGARAGRAARPGPVPRRVRALLRPLPASSHLMLLTIPAVLSLGSCFFAGNICYDLHLPLAMALELEAQL